MTKEEKKKILDWIFANHEHHIEIDQYSTDAPLICEDAPYVNSLELEKFIKEMK